MTNQELNTTQSGDAKSSTSSTSTNVATPDISGTSSGKVSRNPIAAYRWVIPIISGIILLGFFTLLGVLLLRRDWDKLGEIKNVLFTLLGALGAAFTQVVNYWLGSSKGSADKTNLLVSSQQSGS
ncbi:MAG TPA: hypothetical protein VHA33_03570 [Candidatus Angelobacter sp.]|jgi:hypothetical protein|nr:hypothetical protein [Candidatus Angelobacter sp.]